MCIPPNSTPPKPTTLSQFETVVQKVEDDAAIEALLNTLDDEESAR